MDSTWKLIDEKTLLENEDSFNFYNGVNVYLTRPHIVNQKVSAIDILGSYTNISITNELLRLLEENYILQDIKMLLTDGACNEDQEMQDCSETKDIAQEMHDCSEAEEMQDCCEAQEMHDSSQTKDSANINENEIIFRNLIPRQLRVYQEVLEVAVLNHEEHSVTFYPKKSDVIKSRITPAFPYKITYSKNSSSVKLEMLHPPYEKSKHTESMEWLKSKVFPKIIKWCQEIPKTPIIPSIKLLSAKDYNVNLHYLKSKYAEKFVKIWPEYNNTDPIKYVYEDIAIAAYLITLWNREREELQLSEKQSFLDLGCGSGLLDHILSAEGYPGRGLDLRKRKIWDAYGPETDLRQEVIQPSDRKLYPGFDWIIGNHADELTPWIPVIASRSSYKTKVFLLPCCFFTFDGRYERIHHRDTQYQSYLKFLISLCTSMGFHAELDKLRIPSTKRTCIVCTHRNYSEDEESEVDKQRKRFIANNLKGPKFSPENGNYFAISTWTGNEPTEERPDQTLEPNFIPRDSVEKVQNCSQLNKDIISSIIKKIFDHLLLTNSTVAVQSENKTVDWNQGGSIEMKEICSLLGSELLKHMKTQNGGVQTFLRNHSFIFEVKNNEIRLKLPCSVNAMSDESVEVKSKQKKKHVKRPVVLRKRNCYFHFNHPQGCPLSSNECTFSHEDIER